MKPMLAERIASTAALRYPVLVSPKLDGVRCLVIDGVAVSRNLKPIPNKFVQRVLGSERLNGLDGELIVGVPTTPDVFQKTMSGVMSVEGEPDFTFWVFDDYEEEGMFAARIAAVAKRLGRMFQFPVEFVPQTSVPSEAKLLEWEQRYVAEGYEGVMVRSFHGPYKQGRSTLKEGWLLKLKRFEDGEARLVGMTSLKRNTNEPTRNALGQLERSSHVAGLIADRLLGSMSVADLKTGVVFDLGTGFSETQRKEFWRQRHKMWGWILKYKFQPAGVKDKPRFPVFLGWRDRRDL